MDKHGREESSNVETTCVTRTPIIKPKRYKHKPKVVREATPKRDPKPKTMKKPAVDDEETKTRKRKYVRKKKEVDEYTSVEESASGEASTHAKKACRRALNFEDEISNLVTEKYNTEMRHPTQKSKNLDLRDGHIAIPHIQNKRMGKEPKNNEAQARKKRQSKKPATEIYPSVIQYNELFENNEVHWLYFKDWQKKGQKKEMIFQAISNTTFAGGVLTFEGKQSFQSNSRFDKIYTQQKSIT